MHTLHSLVHPPTLPTRSTNPTNQTVSANAIPDGWMGLDNGPESTKMIQAELADCKTIIWNGPMGVFEFDKFAAGTFFFFCVLARRVGCVLGAGDMCVRLARLRHSLTHVINHPLPSSASILTTPGTSAIATTLAELTGKGATTIVGGGDSVAAVEKAGLADKLSHVSTGGGASLELLEGRVLPGVAALNDA